MTIPSSSPAIEPARSQSLTGEWRQYARFIKWPVLPDAATGFSPGVMRDVLRLYVLDILVMAVLVTVGFLIVALGFEMPQNALEGMDWGMGLILLVMLGAPIYEELIFRSWLSGRPAHLGAVVAFIAGFVLTGLVAGTVGLGFAVEAHETMAVSLLGLVVGAVLAAIALWRIPARTPFRWFRAIFPLLFALSSLAFAAIHLANYEEGSLKLLLPLVIPQLIAGTIFGFARVRYGLWAAILLHILHNSTAMLVILMAGQFAD